VEWTIPVGELPTGVTAASGRVYVGLAGTGSLAIVDAFTGVLLGAFPGGGSGAAGIAVDTGKVYLAHPDDNRVSVFDAATGTWLKTVAVGNRPLGVAAAAGRVYVANADDGTVSVLNAVNDAVLATVAVGSNPAQVVATADRAFITRTGGGLAVVGRDGSLLAAAAVPGPDSFGIAFDAFRNRLYVGSRISHTITALDATALTPLYTLSVPFAPYALTVNPATNRIFVVSPENNCAYIINAETMTLCCKLLLSDQGGAAGGQGIALLGDRIFVANRAAGSLTALRDDVCP